MDTREKTTKVIKPEKKSKTKVELWLSRILFYTTLILGFVLRRGDDYTWSILLFILAFFLFILLYSVSMSYKEAKRLKDVPEIHLRIKVIEKSKNDYQTYSKYFITVETEERVRKVFEVDNKIYNSILINETGYLVCKSDNISTLIIKILID